MANRTDTIGVRVTPDERVKFEDYIRESNEFDSLSRFLRIAATRHINTEGEDVSIDPEDIIDAVDTAVAPLSERLDQVEDHIVSIDANVSDDDEIDKLARDLYSSLPVHSDGGELPDIGEVSGTASDFVLAQAISTPFLWSEYYDQGVADVRRACARMLEYYPDVEYVSEEIGGEESNVPTHDNIEIHRHHGDDDIDETYTHGDEPDSDPAPDRNRTTERRYYKTEAN